MTSESTNQYIKLATDVLEKARKLMSDTKWDPVATSNEGTKLEKKDLPDVCPIPCYLVTSTIDKPKDELVNKVWEADFERAKKNDPQLKMMVEVESGPYWKVRSQYNGLGPLIYDRHTVFAQVKMDIANSTYLVGYSVDHPKVPLLTSHVRTQMHMSVYEFTELTPNKTQIKRIAQVDPKGSIPVWIVKMFANNNMKMFDMWRHE